MMTGLVLPNLGLTFPYSSFRDGRFASEPPVLTRIILASGLAEHHPTQNIRSLHYCLYQPELALSISIESSCGAGTRGANIQVNLPGSSSTAYSCAQGAALYSVALQCSGSGSIVPPDRLKRALAPALTIRKDRRPAMLLAGRVQGSVVFTRAHPIYYHNTE
jgi:hypothetical protein